MLKKIAIVLAGIVGLACAATATAGFWTGIIVSAVFCTFGRDIAAEYVEKVKKAKALRDLSLFDKEKALLASVAKRLDMPMAEAGTPAPKAVVTPPPPPPVQTPAPPVFTPKVNQAVAPLRKQMDQAPSVRETLPPFPKLDFELVGGFPDETWLAMPPN